MLVIANELRSSLDDFLQCLRSPSLSSRWGHDLTEDDPILPVWNIQVFLPLSPRLIFFSQEIELFDSDLEIFRGAGGYLAVRPVKIFLCIQSPL
jgi:hypothetical protein